MRGITTASVTLLASTGIVATPLPPVSGYAVAEVIKAVAMLVSTVAAAYIAVKTMAARRQDRRDPPSRGGPPSVTPSMAGLILLIWPLSLAIVVMGCADTDAQLVYGARSAYVTALDAAVDLRRAGALDDAAYARVEAARQRAASILAALDAKAALSQPVDSEVEAMAQQLRQLAVEISDATKGTRGAK